MNNSSRTFELISVIVFATLMILAIPASYLWAGPPLPDDYSPEEETELDALLEGELLNFGEDYVDLIDELEDVLAEFEDFFEEFGQVSIKEYEKAIRTLRASLDEDYSAESYENMMLALDELLLKFEELELELSESESKLQHKRLRNLRALEDDIDDIREQLDEEVGDARLYYKLDSEALSVIITQAFKEARIAMIEAQIMFESKEPPEVPEVPEVPELPDIKHLPRGEGLARIYYEKARKANFDGSMTQSGIVTVDNRDITVELENDLGGVETETWNRSEVSAELTIGYREDSKRSRNLAQEIKLVLDHSPEAIKVRVVYPKEDDETVNIVSSFLTVSVPRENPLRIKNSFGQVIVEDLANDLDIRSNFSQIDVQRIKGNVFITNSSGAIYLEDIDGDLEITNSFAPIEAVYIKGHAELSNSYAPVIVEKSAGQLDINTSGMVAVDRHDGDAKIYSSNGEIDIFGITGKLTAVNSFGQMQVEKVGGDAEIENTNAPTEITGVKGQLVVSNKFAPITISNIGGKVTVKSSNGAVSVEEVRAGVSIINRFDEVSVSDVAGPVSVFNTNAPVTVSEVMAAVNVVNQFSPVMLSAITGDVKVENQNASVDLTDIDGAVIVNTTFGLISCENIRGSFIIGNDNGSVEMVRVIGIDKDSEVQTTFGDILLELSQLGSCNLMATTSYGEIDSDVPMKINSSGSISTGEYITGKSHPSIKLTGNNSSIKITTE